MASTGCGGRGKRWPKFEGFQLILANFSFFNFIPQLERNNLLVVWLEGEERRRKQRRRLMERQHTGSLCDFVFGVLR